MCISNGVWSNFDQINISHRRSCSTSFPGPLPWLGVGREKALGSAGHMGRFPFGQKFRKFRFGAKWKTFFRFARLENSQKKWNCSKGSPVFPVGTSQWKFLFHLQNFSSLSPVPCLSRSFKRPGFPGPPSCFQKMAADPGQVSGRFLQTNFRATTSALPATF